ncbi:hypothetical protein FOA52_006674 [Chlamydomonas sp. UWO 241]|nr:hypothetical protein FOA52_006674 [Chlamydomonas sp. UWO 241]
MSPWGWLAAAVLAFVAFKLINFINADCDGSLKGVSNHAPNAFNNKVVWVTGASQGLGIALVNHFAASGAKLILSARNVEALEKVKARLPTPPGDVLVLPFDLCGDDASIEAAAAKADAAFGGAGIDFLVHNAGASQHAMAEDVTSAITKQMFDLNTLGPINLTRAVLPHMLRRRHGRFVVIASMAAKVPSPGQAVYTACKMALYGYFSSLATEVVDRGVSVTICCPGPVSSGSDVPVERRVYGPTGMVSRTEEPNPKGKVAPQRYAQLVANAAAAGLDECWIAKHPVLLVGHIIQFVPRLGWALLLKGWAVSEAQETLELQLLEELYEEAEDVFYTKRGSIIPRTERALVDATGGTAVYGEVMPDGVANLVAKLNLSPDDVFTDLGSGLGRCVAQVALTSRAGRCIGVELSESRNEQARWVLDRLRGAPHGRALAHVDLREGDITRCDLEGGTHFWLCSTAFGASGCRMIAERLVSTRSFRVLVTSRAMPPTPYFRKVGEFPCAYTWNLGGTAHVYTRTDLAAAPASCLAQHYSDGVGVAWLPNDHATYVPIVTEVAMRVMHGGSSSSPEDN